MQDTEYRDIESEITFIGCLLNKPEDVQVYDDLLAEDFTEQALFEIYQKIKSESEDGIDINVKTIAIHFDGESRKLVMQCSVKAMGALSSTYYSLLKKLTQKRSFERILKDATERLKTESVDEILESIEGVASPESRYVVKTTAELYKENYDLYSTSKQAISTGIMPLDNSMGGGLYEGRFYCIAARQKVGKTIALASIMHNVSTKVPVLFFAAEMGGREITQRLMSYDAGLNSINFSKDPTPANQQKYADVTAKSDQTGYWIDCAGMTVEKIYSLTKRYVKKYKIRGIVIDYLQILGGKMRNESEAEWQGRIAQKLAEIAKRLNIFILTAAQLNRDGELRGSDGIRNAVDQLYFMHKADNETADRWMTLEASRYTLNDDVGSKESPALSISKIGPYLIERGF